MKKVLSAVTLAALAGVMPVSAAENAADVGAVEDLFFSVLPEGMRDGVTVKPSGDRFEVQFDLARMVAGYGGEFYLIKAAEPFIQYVTPLGDGLWQFQADMPFSFASQLKSGGRETSISYKIEQIQYDGVLDTAISFYRNLTASMRGISAESNGGPESVTVTTDTLNYRIAADNLDAKALDITGSGEIGGFREVVFSPKAGRLEFRARRGDVIVKAKGLNMAALKDLFSFFGERNGRAELTDDEKSRLKDKLLAILPVWQHVSEGIDLSDFSAVGPELNFTAENVHYGIELDGISNNASYAINLSATKPGVPQGMLPPELEAALPREISVGFAAKDLNLGDAATYYFEHLEVNGGEPLSSDEQAHIKEILLPDGKLNIAFENITAKSDVYDFSAEGSMTVYPEEKDRQSAHFVIYARDLDKTVAFLQQNAKLFPKFNQAAFMALMVKGFAVTEADGRLKWDIELSEQKEVRINGQVMSFPK